MKKLMIYGAAGYTGGMAAEHAAAAGLPLVLAGFEGNRADLAALAARLGTETRIFSLDDPKGLAQHLAAVDVLLNAAGPFANTAEPLMAAAIAAGVHYLDFSAELDTYREALSLDAPARAAGVMLLPGSGGSVAMLGSLAAHAVRRVSQPKKISIALLVAGGMSRGSVASASQSVVNEILHLVNGELLSRTVPNLRDFDFGQGPLSSFPATLPDLVTIQHATCVQDIETYVHVTAGAFPDAGKAAPTAGPSATERDANRYRAVVEVTGADGSVVRSLLETVNGYSFTALAAAEAARRVLDGEVQVGFQTPAALFGSGFAQTIADTTIVDL